MEKISEAEFSSDHVVLGGNFNHLVEIDYRGRVCERRMHRRESASWHHLTLQYELMDAWSLDSFRKMLGKSYTFDNGRAGPGAAVSRIDKFLILQELDSRGGRIEASPSIRKISDHSPLVMTIWGHPSTLPSSAPYFNTSLLKEEESKATLLLA